MTSPQSDPPEEEDAVFDAPRPEDLSAFLNQYEIHSLIASGGMGAVYRGLQKGLGRPVAIKLLPADAAMDVAATARFRTEAKAMARLSHAHIPAVYDFGVENEYCFFVMELVEGSNAHQLIRQGAMTPDLALTLISQVCDALHYAHLNGVLHGDIKPANILVSQEHSAKLADFGVARLMEQTPETDANGAEWATMGTPEYAAPELFIPGMTAGPPADIYALGVVLHEMLTGAPPRGEFELPAHALRLDPRVDTVIATCMRTEPSERYPDAQAVREAVDAIRLRPRRPETGASAVRHMTMAAPRNRPMPRRGSVRYARKAVAPSAGPGVRPAGYVRPPTRPPVSHHPAGKNRRTKKRSDSGLLPTVVVAAVLLVAGVCYLKTRRRVPSPPPAPPHAEKAPGSSGRSAALPLSEDRPRTAHTRKAVA